MRKFFYKFFKFAGDAFLTSYTEKLRKKDLDFFNPIHRYQVDQFEECYKHFKKWGDVICDGTFDSFIAQCNATQPLQCRDDLNFWSDQVKHRTFARDSLLYQLGNVMRYI